MPCKIISIYSTKVFEADKLLLLQFSFSLDFRLILFSLRCGFVPSGVNIQQQQQTNLTKRGFVYNFIAELLIMTYIIQGQN